MSKIDVISAAKFYIDKIVSDQTIGGSFIKKLSLTILDVLLKRKK